MLRGTYRFPQMQSAAFGKPFTEALAEEVDRLNARAVFVLASGTLARETGLVEQLRRMLGNRFAGLCAKIGAHTLRTDVVAAANMARKAGADLIVTLGGGSVTDAAKMVGLCLGNDVRAPEHGPENGLVAMPTVPASASNSTTTQSAASPSHECRSPKKKGGKSVRERQEERETSG